MLVHLVGWLWLLGVVVAASEDANYNKTSSEDEMKPDAAASKYYKHHHSGRRHHSEEYDDDDHYGSYGYRNSYYPPQPYYLPPPLRDQYVCDLDASVLLAMDGHSYGYNKAIRVRCADVTNDADSCNVCCMNSARKDTSITNDQIRSFLVLVDNHKKHHHKKDKDDKSKDEDKDDDEEMKRRKRSAGYGYGNDYYSRDRYHSLKVKSVPWKADDYYNNVKCVCCAPKRDIVVPPVGQAPPSSPYAQPVPLVQTVQAPAFNTQPSWSSQPQQSTGSGTVWPQQPVSTVQQTQPAGGNWNTVMPQPPAPPPADQSQTTWDKPVPSQQPAAAATSSQTTWTH